MFEPRPPHAFYSGYKYNTTGPSAEQYHNAEASYRIGRAVWQLILAMIAKAVLTIFTFGMKVCVLYNIVQCSLSYAIVIF